jgi:hypothetical protein
MFYIEGKLNTLPDLAFRVQAIAIIVQDWTEEEIDRVLENAHVIGHFSAFIMYKHITITREIRRIPNLYNHCLDQVKECNVCR